MKSKRPNKKLSFNKTTVASLANREQGGIRGGYNETELWGTCNTWHPICVTKPIPHCPFTLDTCTANNCISVRICLD